MTPAALQGLAQSHGDPLAPVLLALALLLAAAKFGGDLAERAGQPAVLGELLAGVLIGNVHLLGVPWFRSLGTDTTVDILARLGVVVLLFEVGLESTVGDMLKVGARSLVVAVVGVVAPWLLGWWLGALLLPDHSKYVHAFLGATLTATSVGITARVLKDLGAANTREARIILGAAVIDDVLGLVVLAVIASVLTAADLGRTPSYLGTVLVFAKAFGFLVGAIGLGVLLSPWYFAGAARLRGRGVLVTTALVLCFGLAYLASVIGLAPIVGAYAAGLVLEEAHAHRFATRGDAPIADLIRPLSLVLAPIFFVVMGIRVDLAALARPSVLALAGVLTLVAIVGKQVCAVGAWRSTLDGLTIGIGMIPRGEVGLIFANLGLGLTVHGERIMDQGTFSAVVLMVVATTLVAPPALKWSIGRRTRAAAAAM
ncbi:MAG TPA: cation:proton antiporter [Gemmatimonadales bacterium]|jgi:Kef-type K+ transport system membrane component KefB|nr:cation:proton antiporter [Gemmatimonadales bacterium]